nr:MaoC family dehydratase N-terminal domain-containing protein [Micromonospora sp. DSM 115978]
DYIGRSLTPTTVVVERGPVARFAAAVKDDSEVYLRPDAAAAAGFAAIPTPPTFSFVMGLLGRFAEQQPEAPADAIELVALIAQLRSRGGMILHAEQEFVFHAPLLVGDTVHTTGRVEDVTVKEGKGGKVMTFVKVRTDVTNDQGEPLVSEIMTLLHRA